MPNFDQELKQALLAAQKAGDYLLKHFGRHHQESLKSNREITISQDVGAEEIIIDLLRKKFPRHGFLREEGKNIKPQAEFTWIVDPLDGTTNYARGIELFSVLIGLAHQGKMVLGVTSLPSFRKVYWAQKDQGAYLNQQPISVSKNSDLSKSVILFSRGTKEKSIKWLPQTIKNVSRKTRTLRAFGSQGVNAVFVASGKFEALINHHSKVTDYAAGAIILEEAGGKVTDFSGKRWELKDGEFLGANDEIHSQLLALLR